MLRRIPVSLKFDDETESEFYYNLIEQKRIDRELTNLICDLLHVYYENEDVRTTVDNYQNEKNPYLLIQENLKRIAIEHSRNVMSASMLSDYTENEKKNLEKAKEAEEKETASEKEFTDEDMFGRIDSSPALLEGIKDRYNLTEKEQVSSNIVVEEVEKKEIESKVEVEEGKSEDIFEEEKSEEVDINEEKEEPIVEKSGLSVGPIKFMDESFDLERDNKPNDFVLDVPEPEVKVSEEPVVEVEDEKVEEKTEEIEQPKVRKPASFGKLMKSMESE